MTIRTPGPHRIDDLVGNPKGVVDLPVGLLGRAALSDFESLAIARWQVHCDDLVCGELLPERFPRCVNAVVQENLLNRDPVGACVLVVEFLWRLKFPYCIYLSE